MKKYTIGQIAKLTDNTPVTIRYYEKIGLLLNIKRGTGGYRWYSEAAIPVLRFIKNSKAIGLNLTEIKELLMLRNSGAPSLSIKKKTQERIRIINNKIDELTAVRDALSTWEQACDGKCPVDQCPILLNIRDAAFS